jgi:hypothetical protein
MTMDMVEILRREVMAGGLVLWVPDSETAKQVDWITTRDDEPGPVAVFKDTTYAALDNCELYDFVVGRRL